MKKRMLVTLMAALLLVLSLAPAALATEKNIASGTCGEGITWSLDGYTLTISGAGEITDAAPWGEHKDHIEHVVLTGGITKICDDAFYKHDRIETVDFGDALVEIGASAFYGCTDIEYLHLPKTFRIFGAKAFRDCTELKYVFCEGGMPRFNDSCLYTGNYISVFYPGSNPWPAEAVNTLVHNFGGQLGVMLGSFADTDLIPEEEKAKYTEPAEPVETTQAAVETTVPTEAATVPATEPATVPTTQATTAPTTEPATVPTTQETVATTAAATETPTTEETESTLVVEFEEEQETPADEVAETIGSKGWIGMVLIAGVLSFLLLGALIFRLMSKKGGRYSR